MPTEYNINDHQHVRREVMSSGTKRNHSHHHHGSPQEVLTIILVKTKYFWGHIPRLIFKGPAPQTPSPTETHVPSLLDTICRVSPWIINMTIIRWGSCPLVGKEIVNKSVVVVSVTLQTSQSVIPKKPHLGADLLGLKRRWEGDQEEVKRTSHNVMMKWRRDRVEINSKGDRLGFSSERKREKGGYRDREAIKVSSGEAFEPLLKLFYLVLPAAIAGYPIRIRNSNPGLRIAS